MKTLSDILNLESELDFESYQQSIVDVFKDIDPDNYYMYRMNGLNDQDIYRVITSPCLCSLYGLKDTK